MTNEDPLVSTILTALSRDVAASLKVDSVKPSDDYFDLGGDSLMAASLLARMRERFAVDITLLDLFEDTTILGIARALAQSCSDR